MFNQAVLVSFLLSCFTPMVSANENQGQPFTVEDLLSLKRVADPQVSPDGQWVAYSVGEVDLDKNKVVNHIWVVSSTPGATPRKLTNHERGESRPRWSPDGKWLAFSSSRSGTPQIWVIAPDGGEAKQISDLSTGASEHVWSPKGDMLAFASDVFPDCDSDDCNQMKASEIEKSGIKAKTIDHLLYRHWSSWRDGKRSHLFLLPFDSQNPGIQKARDLTPGNYEVPPFSLGGPDAFAFSPDGKEIAYTRGPDPSVEAWSTNADLFVVSVDGGTAKNITQQNPGWDGSPQYSPNGRYIVFRSQKRDGYESDLVRLSIYDREAKQIKRIFSEVNESVEEFFWASADSSSLCAVTQDAGTHAVWWGNNEKDWLIQEFVCFKILSGPNLNSFSARSNTMVASLTRLDRAPEIFLLKPGKKRGPKNNPENLSWTPLTQHNESFFAAKEMPSYESVWYEGAKGAKVQAWLVKPPGFQPSTKYPFLYFIHGGPQGAWMDAFSYRWNPMLFAAQGYVVMLPNPRGSTGFGHPFTEAISGDWAGACYEDLMKGVDWAIAQGFVDSEKMGAAGGSFGGYMVNWILGHNNRFKALVSHAGVYNLESMYGTTEELWFPEWDLKGKPWDDREGNYARFSPHRFAGNFSTPTLVIHGELDFRVNVTEGMQLFTALQRRGVPSRFLYYPDEGHWILKPKNSRLWNQSVLQWFDQYLIGKKGLNGQDALR